MLALAQKMIISHTTFMLAGHLLIERPKAKIDRYITHDSWMSLMSTSQNYLPRYEVSTSYRASDSKDSVNYFVIQPAYLLPMKRGSLLLHLREFLLE